MLKINSLQTRTCLMCFENRTNLLVKVPQRGIIPVCGFCLPQVELLPIMYELAE